MTDEAARPPRLHFLRKPRREPDREMGGFAVDDIVDTPTGRRALVIGFSDGRLKLRYIDKCLRERRLDDEAELLPELCTRRKVNDRVK